MRRLFGKRPETRRRAGRVKHVADADAKGPARPWRRRGVVYGILLSLAFIIVLELLFPRALPETGVELQVGQVAREEIVAPYDFDVLKSEDALEQERTAAAEQVVPVFRLNEGVQTVSRTSFGEFLTRVYEIRGGTEPRQQKLDMLGQLGVVLSESTREILLNEERASDVEERAREILFVLYDTGILRERGTPEMATDATVTLLEGDDESIVRTAAFIPEQLLVETVQREAGRTFDDPERTIAVKEILSQFLEGNIVYDADETARRRRTARENVSEFEGRDFKQDEIIIERGERVTEDHLTILRSMERRRQDMLRDVAGITRFFPQLGRMLQAALLLFVFTLYVSVRKPKLITEIRYTVLFSVLLTTVMIAAAIIVRVPDASPYLVPVALLAMLGSLLFDFETSVFSTLIVVLIASIYTGFGMPFTFVSVAAAIVAAHSVRRVRHREDFYWAGIRVVGVYAAAIAIADIVMVEVDMGTLSRMGWGGLNAVISMGIVIVTLPLFERGFRVTTDVTLLELGDMNKPLLRKMAMTAPGTYHHSIVVGNLGEAAAEAIGANGLLTRVGAYYHDIGKLVNPGYFIENQQGLDAESSKHTGLKPKVSSLVIRAHVKDGIELAHKENVPEPLIDLIREHHGTSLMEYFYNQARKEAEDPDEVTESDYCYPGPRPRSKESAILMLADILEARTRSIGDSASPKRIESEIADAIEKRWKAHQLDDAELTLSDLRKIREAYFRVLVGMYHQRVKYPDQAEGEEGQGGLSEDGDESAARREVDTTPGAPDEGTGAGPTE